MIKILKNSTAKIICALILGAIFGGIMKILPSWIYADDIIVNGVFKLLGNGFIELIKMTVIPLVFVSLVCGISSFGDTKKLGSVGAKTLFIFLIMAVLSIALSTAFSLIFKPGEGLNMSVLSQSGEYEPQNTKNLVDMFLNIIPSNPIGAMSEGNLLQVLIFALFFGVSLGSIGKKAQVIIKAFDVINDCIMKIVSMIMKAAPIGVFALISNAVYSMGIESLVGILKLCGVVLLSLAVQAFVTYGLIYKIIAKMSFLKFLKNFSKVAGMAFSTSSSNATLPLSMEMMNNMGVSKSIYQFTLPIGATISKSGTAIMQVISAIFISQAYGISLPMQSIITIAIISLFASVSSAGVPGVGIVMMTMILESVGLPVDGIALIIGFDRILDMIRTVVNVLGACVCTVSVAKSEGDIDMEKYYSTYK